MLASPVVRFTVKDGAAVPREVTLRLSRNEVGCIRVTLHDDRGKPMPEAPVAIQDGVAGVYSGRTDAEGRMTTPTLLCGTYDILTSHSSHPLLRQRVDVKPGVNPVLLSYKGLVILRGTVVLASGRTPALFEGGFYPRLGFAESSRIGNRKGTFEVPVMPDAFPMLILVYAEAGKETHSRLPAVGAVLLDEPPSGDIRVTVSDAAARTIRASLPRKWVAADRSQAYLWFCRKGTVVPVAICRLRPGGSEPAEPQQTVTLSGEARLEGGDWDVVLRRGLGSSTRIAWLGSVTVLPTGPIQLTLADKDIRAEGTLAEVREALKSQVNRPPPKP